MDCNCYIASIIYDAMCECYHVMHGYVSTLDSPSRAAVQLLLEHKEDCQSVVEFIVGWKGLPKLRLIIGKADL